MDPGGPVFHGSWRTSLSWILKDHSFMEKPVFNGSWRTGLSWILEDQSFTDLGGAVIQGSWRTGLSWNLKDRSFMEGPAFHGSLRTGFSWILEQRSFKDHASGLSSIMPVVFHARSRKSNLSRIMQETASHGSWKSRLSQPGNVMSLTAASIIHKTQENVVDLDAYQQGTRARTLLSAVGSF